MEIRTKLEGDEVTFKRYDSWDISWMSFQLCVYDLVTKIYEEMHLATNLHD